MTDDYEALLDEVRDYVKMTDGTVEDEIGPDIQDGREISGLRVGRAGYVYDVLGSPDADYFLLRFGFNLLENLRNSGVENPAAVLASGDETEMETLILNLIREVSHPSVEVGVETTDDGVFAAFTVERKIFVDDPSFGVRDFEEAVRAVVAQGDRGIKHLQLALDIGGEAEPGRDDGDRGFM
ncbi:MAG: hypothetical protein ACLFSW_00090 [Halobacteriales archaeon]